MCCVAGKLFQMAPIYWFDDAITDPKLRDKQHPGTGASIVRTHTFAEQREVDRYREVLGGKHGKEVCLASSLPSVFLSPAHSYPIIDADSALKQITEQLKSKRHVVTIIIDRLVTCISLLPSVSPTLFDCSKSTSGAELQDCRTALCSHLQFIQLSFALSVCVPFNSVCAIQVSFGLTCCVPRCVLRPTGLLTSARIEWKRKLGRRGLPTPSCHTLWTCLNLPGRSSLCSSSQSLASQSTTSCSPWSDLLSLQCGNCRLDLRATSLLCVTDTTRNWRSRMTLHWLKYCSALANTSTATSCTTLAPACTPQTTKDTTCAPNYSTSGTLFMRSSTTGI